MTSVNDKENLYYFRRMNLDKNKQILLNHILSKMISWEENNLGRTKRFGQYEPDSLREYMMAIQFEIFSQYKTNAHDYSMLIRLLGNDNHILIDENLHIKVNLGAKKFLADGGYDQSKLKIWAKNPENTWKILVFILGTIVTIFLAMRKMI